MLFDTHAHYDDGRFTEELDKPLDDFITELFSGDVKGIINAGTNIETCKKSIELSEKFDGMYAAVGIHPSDCYKYSDMDGVLDFLCELSRHKKVVAIGEIGLDYHYDFSPRDIQKVWFKAQLELARQLDLPAVIHDRDAHGDVFDMIKSTKGVRCVMHSCSESAEAVRQLTDMGHYISFSGSVTFKNAKNTVLSAEACPLDKILIETDCPYLAPTPHRGKLNHSGLVRHTAEKLAEIKGISYEEICRITYENALRFFNITQRSLDMKKLTMLISAILCASTLFSCAQDTATGTDTSPVTDKVTENVTDAVTDAVTDGVTEEITEIVTDAETEAPAGISDEEYKQQLMDKGFPESYAVLLCDVHKRHPEWQFNPIMITDLSGGKYTWDYVIAKEIEDDENNTVYHTLEGVLDYAIDTKPVESGIWFRAKPESVRFFMDPRNFMNEKNMFMFERLNSDTVTYSPTVVESLLEGTFMFRKSMGDEGSNMKYSECFVEVAKKLGISPLVIAARLRQEQGVNGTSPLISGTCGDTLWQYYNEKSNNAPAFGFSEAELKSYNGYYNFFNIQATGNGYFEVFLAGMREALQGGWTSKYKAVEGGAAKLKSRYIDDYQQTLYFQKFNVDPRSGRNFWGQYMQAVHAAYDEARSTYNAYRRVNMLNSAFVFDIPVYAGMPEAPCPNPGTRYT